MSGSTFEMTAKKRGLQVFHKGLILVGAPLIVEILLIMSLALLLQESDKESLRESKYRRCNSLCAKLISISNEAVIVAFGCYQGDTETFLQIYDSDKEKMEQRKTLLKEAAKGDSMTEKAAKQLLDSIEDLSPVLDQVVEPARHGKRIFEISGTMKDIQHQFSSKRDINMERMSSVTTLQEKMASASARRQAHLQELQFQILSVGLAVNIALGFMLLNFYRKSIVRRLQTIMENTTRLAEGKPLQEDLDGSDEIARLDQSFHSMDRDLKLAATREKALFENASDVICILDKDLNFKKMNPACRKLWGLSPESLVDRSLLQLIRESDRARTAKLFAEALQKGELNELEVSIVSQDGHEIETLWSTYYIEGEGQLYCVIHDISERKQIERSRQAFISMLSSDLKQPLSRISDDLVQLLGPLKTQLQEKTAGRLEQVKTNIGRLLSLVNDLLTLTESQSNTFNSAKENCLLEDLLKRSWLDLEGMARKSGIACSIECEAGTTIYADPNKIMQVIVNLGSNAIKFSPEAATIRFTAIPVGEFIEIQIIDEGRGVPESHRQAIFEKFQQVSLADGKRKAGTGLGLPICKDIVEEHGGSIGVISREGQGSTFWFRIPKDENAYKNLLFQRQQEEHLKRTNVSAPAQPQFPVMIAPSAGANMSLMKKGLLLIGVPLIFELVFVLSISAVLIQTEKSREEELHERKIAAAAYKLLDSYFTNSLVVVRNKSYENWLLYDQISEEMITAGKELKKLVKGDKAASALFKPVEKIHDSMVERIEYGREIISQGFSRERALKAVPERYEIWAKAAGISKRLGRLIDDSEKREFNNPSKQLKLRKQQGLLLLLGLSSNIALSLFLARFFSKDISSRLALQADNASRLARDKELNPVLAGTDEIARLDSAFHESAEKLAEARKKERAIFDNSRDLICVLDSSSKFLSSNPAGEKIFARSKEEILASKFTDFVCQEDCRKLKELLSADLSQGKLIELRLQPVNNCAAYLLVSLARPSGQENIYCIAHDISDRKELEQMKQDFLSVVSHDLRSPLTSMTGTATFIEMGGTGEIGPEASAVVHDIVLQSEQLVDLINDLLDLEKFQSGKMQLGFEPVSAGDILEAAWLELKNRFDHINIELTDNSGDPDINADKDRLSQALSSLLSHLAARVASGGVLRIVAEKQEELLSWRIYDPANQIEAKAANMLFERNASSNLSLPLAASIIEAHAGRIQVLPASNGKGSVFEILLPLYQGAEKTNESKAEK